MWDVEFLELMPAQIGFRKKKTDSTNLYGTSEHDTARPTLARVQENTREVVDVEGNTRTIEGDVYCPPPAFWVTRGVDGALVPTPNAFTPTTDDLLVLPSGTEVKIIRISEVWDDDSVHHLKVSYG